MSTCRYPDCDDRAQTSKSYCAGHFYLKYQSTSDGVKTGRVKKLTAEQCAEMRRMSSKFATNRAIGEHFGVSLRLVREVLRREYVPRD